MRAFSQSPRALLGRDGRRRCSPLSSSASLLFATSSGAPCQALLPLPSPLTPRSHTSPVVAATATATFTTRTAAGSAGLSAPRHGRPTRRLQSPTASESSSSRFCGVARPFSVSGEKKTGREEPPSFAFAFDIDGVLLHVAKPIPGAAETLRYLQAHAVPFILLTNGGGKHEAERVADLSARLGVPLSVDNFVQSHTPFRELVQEPDDGGSPVVGEEVENLRGKTVLVTGSDAAKAREIAEAYGFGPVVIPADILKAYPDVFPFDPLMKERYAATARPLPESAPGSGLKVDAILVFNDPRDWALDVQLITDLLLSRQGYLGTYSARNGDASLPGRGWQRDGQPRVYFSNPDLFWSAHYHLPRLGQGAFQAALAGAWAEITATHAPGHAHPHADGGNSATAVSAEPPVHLRRTVIGKPHRRTYRYAERVLAAHRASLLAASGLGSAAAPAPSPSPLKTVYMVGDNPESDIRGANDYASPVGTEWASVLVRTGVWNPDRAGEPRHKPRMIVDDVAAAVNWALKREGWR